MRLAGRRDGSGLGVYRRVVEGALALLPES
jgi:hypothetical protein